MAGGNSDIAAAWGIVAELAAAAYGVPRDDIQAESRGRGPRPPQRVWTAKKVAIYLAVAVTGADYAALGRALGLHRDTVASHCAWAREAMAVDAALEELAIGLERAAHLRLAAGGVVAAVAPADPLKALLEALSTYASSVQPTLNRQKPASSDSRADHENVIAAGGTAC